MHLLNIGESRTLDCQVTSVDAEPVKKPIKNNEVNNQLALVYMFSAMALFALTDALVKLLTQSLSPIQIVWGRQSGLLLGVIIILAWQGLGVLNTTQPKLQISRGCLAVISATLFVIGVTYVPLADAVAITFVAPFFVTVMGAVFLKESVGIRRWSAVIIGFLATLIILRPGMGVMHPAAVLLILAAAAFACRQILSRILSNADSTLTTVAYTAIVSWVLLTIPLAYVWQTPDTTQEIFLIITVALVAAIAETLLIMALQTGLAVVVAPVQYSLMIWGTLYGYLLFNQLPDFWTLVGAVIIVITGLYTLNRERLKAKENR